MTKPLSERLGTYIAVSSYGDKQLFNDYRIMFD